MKKGIIVYVLRKVDGYDCTKNGISSKYQEFVLIGDNIKGDTLPSKKRPALELSFSVIAGKPYLKAIPLGSKEECMFGGNYITSSEARFPHDYPIPVHDRIE
jgi:hypothetical protein